MLTSALSTPRLYLLYTTQCFVIKLMHLCDGCSSTEVILVCPWRGSVTEAEALMLSLPLTAHRRILCDRGWNEMSGDSPTNIDWLHGFGCLERGDRESARPWRQWNGGSDCLFLGCNAIWFMPGQEQICPQVDYKIRVDLKWKHHDSASNPRQWGWACTAGASARCYLTGSETIRFGIGIVVPEPFTVTDAAISNSDDCQVLTRLCVKHPSAPQF